MDFDTADGDALDFSGMLNGFDPLQDAIDDFVFHTEENGNTTVAVDIHGSGDIMNAVDIAVLENVIDLDINADIIM